MENNTITVKIDDSDYLRENNLETENMVTQSKATTESSKLESFPIPVPKWLWRIFLVIAVFLYSSYTIFVHLCEIDGKLPFKPSAAVLTIELLKLILSFIMFTFEMSSHYSGIRNERTCTVLSPQQFCSAIKDQFNSNMRSETGSSSSSSSLLYLSTDNFNNNKFKMKNLIMFIIPFTIPAILYAINNNLGIFIQLEMDPATYQVLGNFKILSTAILFRLIINKHISRLQWFSLFLLLCAGINHSYNNIGVNPIQSTSTNSTQIPSLSLHITATGLCMVTFYCTISGLSGVYTEYVMKKSGKMSIHLQNGLLYIFGVIINALTYIIEIQISGEQYDLFKGFTYWTWLFVITQAISGIFMGFVMKYANNIVRLFIISTAMILTTILSIMIFSLQLKLSFFISVALVLISIFIYHY